MNLLGTRFVARLLLSFLVAHDTLVGTVRSMHATVVMTVRVMPPPVFHISIIVPPAPGRVAVGIGVAGSHVLPIGASEGRGLSHILVNFSAK